MPPTPTQNAYKRINENASCCHILTNAVQNGGRTQFGIEVDNMVACLGISEVSTSSIKSNLFRYGSWRKNFTDKELHEITIHWREANRKESDIYCSRKHGISMEARRGGRSKHVAKQIIKNEKYMEELVKIAKHGELPRFDTEIKRILEEMTYRDSVDSFLISTIVREHVFKKHKLDPDNKEKPMKIETHTFINDVRLDTLNDNQLINYITDLENKIERRGKIKTQSTKIAAEIKKMQTQCEELAKILDSRE